MWWALLSVVYLCYKSNPPSNPVGGYYYHHLTDGETQSQLTYNFLKVKHTQTAELRLKARQFQLRFHVREPPYRLPAFSCSTKTAVTSSSTSFFQSAPEHH